MMIILSFLIGVVLGTIAGLVPGIHPNIYSSLILFYLSGFDKIDLCIILISSVVINSFVSFIPSIIFGVVESSTSLSVLPGHRFLLKGKGYYAIYLTVIGGLFGTLLLFVFLYPILILATIISENKMIVLAFLLFVSFFMIWKEKNKLRGLFVFLCSGLLGFFFLDKNLYFSIFSGLFALPMLFISWWKKSKLPEYFDFEIEEKVRKKGLFVGLISGVISSLFPSVGPAQSSVISQEIVGEKDDENFLISMGSITTIDAILSLVILWFLGKARNGITVGVKELIGVFSFKILILFLLVSLSSVFLSVFITMKITKIVLLNIRKFDYSLLSRNIFFLLIFLSFIFDGTGGLLVLFSSFFLGLIANIFKVKRSELMGVLIIPTILLYLGLI